MSHSRSSFVQLEEGFRFLGTLYASRPPPRQVPSGATTRTYERSEIDLEILDEGSFLIGWTRARLVGRSVAWTSEGGPKSLARVNTDARYF